MFLEPLGGELRSPLCEFYIFISRNCLPHSTIGHGTQDFPFAQSYLSHVPAGLVGWVTTSEYLLLNVFASLFLFLET
jgi:hypothetical protein